MSTANGSSFVVDDYPPARRSLRVALVTETYPPEVNGVAATVSRVVEGLRLRGHQLQLVRPRQDRAEAAGDGGGGALVLMAGMPIPRYPQLKLGLPAKRALMKLWSTQRPDVVHVVTEGPLGWSALQAALHLKLPVVSDFRTNFHSYSKHYGVGWLRAPVMAYLRKFHNRTACTMVPTEGLRSELAAAGFKGLRVGRLAPEKNLGTVLAAAEAMRADDRKLRLVLVGDGPDRARLQQRSPDTVFAGVQRGTELAAHYASADVFLFASMTETFGNVVPEAMASGLAVVAYDHAAAGQLIRHGDNGLLARLDDSAGFCALARRLAGDLPQARQLGARARETAAQMDWGRIVESVEDEYLAAITGPVSLPSALWNPALPLA
jgi:glycosyltransferase involved in cell wall biosynthesis